MGYILFSSENKLSIYAYQTWNGIIEYSYDNRNWEEWHGETIINNAIYMRGVNNTIISNRSKWTLKGTNIKCQGNIENLLDYKSVINNVHPKMAKNCFHGMFCECNLIEAPQLLATELTDYCYAYMFDGCKKLTIPPKLPSVNLAIGCYAYMFYGCSSLIKSPLLMATKLKTHCYYAMLEKCSSLIEPPNLLASQLCEDCYWEMFCGCTSLQISPFFPNLAIAKESIINQDIFDKCPIRFININNKLYDINVLKLL